jgi:hypothetical protein
MPRRPRLPWARCGPLRPSTLDVLLMPIGKVCHRVGPAWQTLPARPGVRGNVDRVTATATLSARLWWPAERSCSWPANRELRCDSGTAPPLCSGDFRPWETRFGREGGRIRAIVVFSRRWWANEARRHAAARARESEDLPGVVSLPDREGGRAGTAARAVGGDTLQGSAPARTAPGVVRMHRRARGPKGSGASAAVRAWMALAVSDAA